MYLSIYIHACTFAVKQEVCNGEGTKLQMPSQVQMTVKTGAGKILRNQAGQHRVGNCSFDLSGT